MISFRGRPWGTNSALPATCDASLVHSAIWGRGRCSTSSWVRPRTQPQQIVLIRSGPQDGK
ncbi:hypothetical protein MGWOODY_Smn2388 [hydrothermal vent metagenome]|uniref:Uncharacterized protein n=1 Tax=hydrothermal vent metagenome TaxID=652676 RepID=A0A170PMR8_9ZZZZ